MAGALADIKVLDFTRVLAGPFCTNLLRDLGAEVIKVEIPSGGDWIRTIPPFTDGGESPHFIARNAGKKSITLNLSSEKGKQIVMDLVKQVDVVVENFSPGVMKRLGFGYDDLSKVNPRIIYAAISGFGHTGPRTKEPAFDIVVQALGGIMGITGFPETPPTKTGPPLADIIGAYNAVISILAALHHRQVSGEGQMIDLSMQDCVFAATFLDLAGSYFFKGQPPKRTGNSHPILAPFGTFPAKDGHVVICIIGGLWKNFARAIDREAWAEDPAFGTEAGRAERKDDISAATQQWTREKTVEEAVRLLKDAHVPCAPVPTYDEVARDPQLASRNMIAEVEQPASGKVKIPGSVFKMSKTPGGIDAPAPALGEHNREIYTGMLGYTDDEIRKLAEEGVI
jgi:crotonobetainyl-CoA:carnitine CoA-transferase CaiB-like acyl-CoA transferase